MPSFGRKQIDYRLNGAPCLPSLSSIESALKELLTADQRYTTQIAEIIRRDPSLTSRLLHLVNSVYYGLANPIKNIEEAVFFLGVRQIRQLAMVTPIIEDFQKLTRGPALSLAAILASLHRHGPADARAGGPGQIARRGERLRFRADP